MNIQEYISSGIVESYVLGLADSAERAEFERMCAAYPEVSEARTNFEILLEKFIVPNTVQPSANLKNAILAHINMDAVTKAAPPAGNINSDQEESIRRLEQVRVVSMSWQRNLAVASVILLTISTALNFYFFNRYREYNLRYEALVSGQQELAANNQSLQARLQDYEKAFEWVKNPNMAIVKMPGVPTGPDPSSIVTVYWNTQSKDVYLMVNQLPAPSTSQQYQLWALVDGKPVDAGVFDITDGVTMIKMKNIPRAQAFAVTLEKRGGSVAPTMEKLYVMGKV